MTPRLATVLSARPWESMVVAHARDTAAVRLVARAYRPEDISDRRDEIDVVLAGAEISWVTPGLVAAWRRSGLTVIGLYPAGDHPGRDLLEAGGADEVLPDDVPVEAIIHAVLHHRPSEPRPPAQDPAPIVAVTGPRGAPGRTEIAIAVAWNWSRRASTLLIDLDTAAPGVAIRLGLPPRPDLTDVADSIKGTGRIPGDLTKTVGALRVIVGSHRSDEPPLRTTTIEEVAECAAAAAAVVVLDLGPAAPDDRILKRADHAVLVADASPTGLVRVARTTAEWSGPPPALVLNRMPSRDANDLVVAARRWTGLDPAVLVPEDPAIRSAARAARPPARRLRRAVGRLEVPA